jgi:hypothetical protein
MTAADEPAARKIHVNKALSMQAVGPTKTGLSRRVDASKELVAVLRDFLRYPNLR